MKFSGKDIERIIRGARAFSELTKGRYPKAIRANLEKLIDDGKLKDLWAAAWALDVLVTELSRCGVTVNVQEISPAPTVPRVEER
jgi:hypothetical protein